MKVTLKGIGKVNYLLDVDKRLQKQLNTEEKDFLEDVATSARRRAPRDTGSLARSIEVTPWAHGWKLQVNDRAALFQEMGFKPHSFFTDPSRQDFATRKLPLYRWITVSKNKPFVGPALESNLSKLSQRISNTVRRSIK